jgi:hypothetical protein
MCHSFGVSYCVSALLFRGRLAWLVSIFLGKEGSVIQLWQVEAHFRGTIFGTGWGFDLGLSWCFGFSVPGSFPSLLDALVSQGVRFDGGRVVPRRAFLVRVARRFGASLTFAVLWYEVADRGGTQAAERSGSLFLAGDDFLFVTLVSVSGSHAVRIPIPSE